MERRILCIADIPQVFGHDPVEHVVDRGKHGVTAPEILVELDLFLRPAPSLIGFIGRVFFQEKLRPCQPEPVDALLHIPHHEHVVPAEPLPGNGV